MAGGGWSVNGEGDGGVGGGGAWGGGGFEIAENIGNNNNGNSNNNNSSNRNSNNAHNSRIGNSRVVSSDSNSSNSNNVNFPFPPIQQQPMENLISAIGLCMQMMFDAIKEASSSGVGLKEEDSRSLAKACIEILCSTQSERPSAWNPHITSRSSDPTPARNVC